MDCPQKTSDDSRKRACNRMQVMGNPRNRKEKRRRQTFFEIREKLAIYKRKRQRGMS
jgi:hypothetical protein